MRYDEPNLNARQVAEYPPVGKFQKYGHFFKEF